MTRPKSQIQMVMKLFIDFLDGLTNSEFESLLNGTGAIKYIDKGITSQKKELINDILYSLVQTNNQQEVYSRVVTDKRLDSKQKLHDFCNFLNIPFKSKDSIETLRLRVSDYIRDNRKYFLSNYEKQLDVNFVLQNISYRLEEITDVDEAVNLLNSNDILRNKSNLISLAKLLDVYITKDLTSDELVKKIVDSVVVAKLRSKAIREKRIGLMSSNDENI